ncbi:5-oxoprolinase [Variovorax sp. WS11]|uniref:hydantoinase/oxoprolinase family protein n=1 Tax=Variovorax sp. WS11 TaxID=1105204 RepID=UPI000D0D0744|nr:hydantoinase/oxoprolinase family protein [Variovorax sp. WS11]NDZ18021.1 hydantoinase/oxoprolinase family protein [Variovorax sp. WS11]PSL80095.1 5-oxoprolinase [Variovorax sp. WS11]
MTYIVAADTGGTFTDLAAYDRDTGRVVYTKSLTNYTEFVDGVMDCVRKADIDLSRTGSVKFGTTLVINTYVQRNGALTAVVTTRGFRDVLEIRRGNRPIPFDLRYEREPALVERELRFTVGERVGARGEILQPLDEAGLERVADELKRLGVQAVAVSFINAYANDAHEQRAAQILRSRLPGVYVCAGTELSREWYEYERTSTAVANAYVGPKLQQYVGRLQDRLAAQDFTKSFFLMASNGGVFSAAMAQQRPVMLVESGPVGGCIGAGVYARELGLERVIAFDMGGTTAKCAVLENGRFEVKSPYYVGGYERGFPVSGGVLDIVEVGTGGGSVAWVDAQGSLHVGPRSAGSTPGPVCYGRGGTEPTVTDANLVLGRIAPSSFLGGEMPLDESGARDAIARLASQLGFEGPGGVDDMAQGILSIGALTMASAIKQITIERGYDARDFAMVAFGGGGPLHTAALARELSIPHLVIPPEPGNFSALGMLLAEARVDQARTFLRLLEPSSIDEMGACFLDMQVEMTDTLARDFAGARLRFEQQVELSFRGQKHSLRLPLESQHGVDGIRRQFEEIYRRRYGHVEEGAPIQTVALVLTAFADVERPDLALLAPKVAASPPGPARTRPVYFAERGRRLETPVFSRYTLPPGFAHAGPAIIEEYGSTTVVGPDDRFEIGRLGEIHIRFH